LQDGHTNEFYTEQVLFVAHGRFEGGADNLFAAASGYTNADRQCHSLLSKMLRWAWIRAGPLAKTRLTPATPRALQGSRWEAAVERDQVKSDASDPGFTC